MSSLYSVIQSLQQTQGSNAKLVLLQEHKDNELLKAYMKATYDPSINWWMKNVIKTGKVGEYEMDAELLKWLVSEVAGRKITGGFAATCMRETNDSLTKEGQDLLQLLLNRSIGAGVGDSIVLRIWPNLYLVPAYMRCSLLDSKTRKHFPDGTTFAIQKKADGQYCSLYTNGKAYTRQGNAYPQWLVAQLLTGADYSKWKPTVLLGEVLVSNRSTGEVLSRQEGNGLINSALKGADDSDFDAYAFSIECWDMIPVADFEAGFCEAPYHNRFDEMKSRIEWELENALVIPTYFVRSLEEAFAINNEHLLEGFEGSVIKTLSHTWKNHTSPYNVKLKVVFEMDLLITAVTEGTGKASGMMGSVTVQSSDGLLVSDVGTGFSDAQRVYVWNNQEEVVGSILALKANDIVSSKGSNLFSLFLPVALEIRSDKREADSYNRCLQQLNSAKGIVCVN